MTEIFYNSSFKRLILCVYVLPIFSVIPVDLKRPALRVKVEYEFENSVFRRFDNFLLDRTKSDDNS